jgi:tetratricopeptide (TPR) repeat protein
MKRVQLVPQGSLNRLLQASTEALNNDDFQKAIDELERASRLAPADRNILLELGRIYGTRYDYAAAERCFEKAIRLAPNKAEVLTVAAQRAVTFSSTDLAEKYFQRATEQKDVPAAAFVGLATVHEYYHRVEEASSLIERALKLEPDNSAALLAQVRFNREAGCLSDAERLTRPMLEAKDKDTQVRAYCELGMILELQERYDDAMAAFLNAKSLLISGAGSLMGPPQAADAYLEKFRTEVSADAIKRWLDGAAHLHPSRNIAFLGGFARSGTTLLEQVLDSHPQMVSLEETQLFKWEGYGPLCKSLPRGTPMLAVLESAQPGLLNQLRANYIGLAEKHIGSPLGTRLLIDKNPSMTVLIPAFIRVFPEIKLLIALRDPRDVCLSNFMRHHLPLSKGNADYLTMEGTVEIYTKIMRFWRTLAPMLQGHYLEVRYEDVVENLEAVSRRTLDFLGVNWDERVLKFDEHARNKLVRSPTYADVARPIYKRAKGRWRNYQKYFEPHLEKLEPFVKAFGY